MINIQTRIVDIDQLSQLAEDGESIRHTPHLGGEITGYHWAMLGGIASSVVLVDTASATNDELGGVGKIDGAGFVNRSWSQSPAAAINNHELNCKKANQLSSIFESLGLEEAMFVRSEGKVSYVNFTQIHESILGALSSDRTTVSKARNYWREQGEVACAMAEFVADEGMFKRAYSMRSRKISRAGRDQPTALKAKGMYYEGNDVSGLLPPVESLLAMHAIRGVMEGRDVVYEFLNPESVDYITKNNDFEERVKKIASGTLAIMGIKESLTYCYLIAEDYSEMDTAGGDANQFYLLKYAAVAGTGK